MGGHSAVDWLAVSWAPHIRLSVFFGIEPRMMHSALAGESDTARSSHPSSAFELSVLSLSSYTQDREGYIIAAGLFSPIVYIQLVILVWCAAAAAAAG